MNTNTKYNLNRLTYFVAIIEEKTITAAAERLGLSKAVVSKQLQLLEEELGVSLVVRNTRHLHATKTGEAFYTRSKEALKYAQHAFDTAAEDSHEPSGLIRLTSPIDLGIFQLAPIITQFCAKYPKVKIEVNLSDEVKDIVAKRYDLSFRVGWLQDSSNRARKIGSFREVALSTPAFAKNWAPKTPKDLSSLPFTAYDVIDRSTRTFIHQASRGTKEQSTEVELTTNLSFNTTLAIREALLTSQYFGVLPDFTVKKDLKAGVLQELLPNWKLREGGIYIVRPPSQLRTQAVQLFIDAIISKFEATI
ncbi:transcriptional regulator, LysR family protein [Marinomonas sp. MED121]|uniref:LysR family transcriptional regulator n=1 Tax=Marinomonas sp. MED121 TaxID=314277 RepID=UPI0000690A1C|nr:LysR family transcriptional regulator [Marinomonas sp. MED121]EAQ64083.1 transcriptional regulator, LysR family protein [Marinomonas sp. MED121]